MSNRYIAETGNDGFQAQGSGTLPAGFQIGDDARWRVAIDKRLFAEMPGTFVPNGFPLLDGGSGVMIRYGLDTHEHTHKDCNDRVGSW